MRRGASVDGDADADEEKVKVVSSYQLVEWICCGKSDCYEPHRLKKDTAR